MYVIPLPTGCNVCNSFIPCKKVLYKHHNHLLHFSNRLFPQACMIHMRSLIYVFPSSLQHFKAFFVLIFTCDILSQKCSEFPSQIYSHFKILYLEIVILWSFVFPYYQKRSYFPFQNVIYESTLCEYYITVPKEITVLGGLILVSALEIRST